MKLASKFHEQSIDDSSRFVVVPVHPHAQSLTWPRFKPNPLCDDRTDTRRMRGREMSAHLQIPEPHMTGDERSSWFVTTVHKTLVRGALTEINKN